MLLVRDGYPLWLDFVLPYFCNYSNFLKVLIFEDVIKNTSAIIFLEQMINRTFALVRNEVFVKPIRWGEVNIIPIHNALPFTTLNCNYKMLEGKYHIMSLEIDARLNTMIKIPIAPFYRNESTRPCIKRKLLPWSRYDPSKENHLICQTEVGRVYF